MKTLKLDKRRMIGTSGSGNQKKYWTPDKYLIKVNSKFREARKEVSAAILAELFGLYHANYEYIKVAYAEDNVLHDACCTVSFLQNHETEITVSEILDYFNYNPTASLSAINYINDTMTCISNYTSIDRNIISCWLTSILLFDYIICNNDRHLTNFEVIYNEKTCMYRLAPIYDNGQSFLNTDSVLTFSEYENRRRKFKTRPFSTNPEKNLGDLNLCRAVFIQMLQHSNGKIGIQQSSMLDGHKMTALRQIDRLCKLLNITL